MTAAANTPESRHRVTVERIIPAAAGAIFDVLADPRRHPLIDGSGTVRAVRAGSPSRLSAGARFGMDMRIGLPYPVWNRVVEFEEARRIAWTHIGGARWIYELEPVPGEGDRTLVRETFDYAGAVSPRAFEFFKFPTRNRAGMEKTLERLEALVAAT